MALIDISAEIKGASAAAVVPVRILSATASLFGSASSGLGRQAPAPTPQVPPERAPGA